MSPRPPASGLRAAYMRLRSSDLADVLNGALRPPRWVTGEGEARGPCPSEAKACAGFMLAASVRETCSGTPWLRCSRCGFSASLWDVLEDALGSRARVASILIDAAARRVTIEARGRAARRLTPQEALCRVAEAGTQITIDDADDPPRLVVLAGDLPLGVAEALETKSGRDALDRWNLRAALLQHVGGYTEREAEIEAAETLHIEDWQEPEGPPTAPEVPTVPDVPDATNDASPDTEYDPLDDFCLPGWRGCGR